MILVTGGLGVIGAYTARALVDLGHEVVVTAHRRRLGWRPGPSSDSGACAGIPSPALRTTPAGSLWLRLGCPAAEVACQPGHVGAADAVADVAVGAY
jgi:NAD(P)-dependent dehydrogenase (short-subunit alcohol dehydrogenase family)